MQPFIIIPSGRGTSPMLPAGMVDMPSLVPGEGRVVPPTGFMPAHRTYHAEERQAGFLFLVEGGRANGPLLVCGQDRANDPGQYLADAPKAGLGVEVVAAVGEVSTLHAPSIRMESDHDVQVRYQKSSSDVRRRSR